MLKNTQQVGNAIKDLRLKKGLTQDQLGEKLKISSQAVSKWENGESYPDIQQLSNLCNEFEVSMDDLMLNTETKKLKKSYDVFKCIDNPKGNVEIKEIQINNTYEILLRIHNKSDSDIPLVSDNFLLVDSDGNMIEPVRQNFTNNDGATISRTLLHVIPIFIPSISSVNVRLIFNKTMDNVNLWINIPNFIEKTGFCIRTIAHINRITNYGIRTMNIEETVDFYNFAIKNNKIPNRNDQHPKITLSILDKIQIPKVGDFYKDYEYLFDEDVLAKITVSENFIDFAFAKQHVKDPFLFRELIKNNYDKIKEDCALGKCGIIMGNLFEDYMDNDILEFIIKLRAEFAKDYKRWTLHYITEDNIESLKPYIAKLKYDLNGELFDSELTNETVNSIIRESDRQNIKESNVMKMLNAYKGKIDQMTIDVLFTELGISNLDTLVKYKQFVSEDCWNKMKNTFFDSEMKKLEILKNNTR